MYTSLECRQRRIDKAEYFVDVAVPVGEDVGMYSWLGCRHCRTDMLLDEGRNGESLEEYSGLASSVQLIEKDMSTTGSECNKERRRTSRVKYRWANMSLDTILVLAIFALVTRIVTQHDTTLRGSNRRGM